MLNMRTEFGQRLFDARKEAELTQVALSSHVGMQQATYSALETSGQGSVFTPLLADKLGVSVSWLAYGTGERHAVNKGSAPAHKGFSPAALEIADLYDMIPAPDKIRRAQAYASATQAILAVLQPAAATEPTTTRSKKQSV